MIHILSTAWLKNFALFDKPISNIYSPFQIQLLPRSRHQEIRISLLRNWREEHRPALHVVDLTFALQNKDIRAVDVVLSEKGETF